MNNEEARPQDVGTGREGLGGPSGESLPGGTDRFTPCGCDESVALWAILSGEAPAPDTVGWRTILHFVEALTLRKLAAIRPMLVRSELDALIDNRFTQLEVLRNTFEIPAWAVSGNAMLARRRAEAA